MLVRGSILRGTANKERSCIIKPRADGFFGKRSSHPGTVSGCCAVPALARRSFNRHLSSNPRAVGSGFESRKLRKSETRQKHLSKLALHGFYGQSNVANRRIERFTLKAFFCLKLRGVTKEEGWGRRKRHKLSFLILFRIIPKISVRRLESFSYQ